MSWSNCIGSFLWTDNTPYGRKTVHMDGDPDIPPPWPLEAMLSPASRFRVVRLLVRLPEKEFTGREMARLLGLSHSSVQEALAPLVEAGLVFRRSVGRAHAYRVNREAHLFGAIRDLLRSEQRGQAELLTALRSLGGDAQSLVLYGSVAVGTPRKGSDVDLLIVAEDRARVETVLQALRPRLARRFGVRLDARVLTTAELVAKASAPHIRAALRGGILLAGVPLREAMRAGD